MGASFCVCGARVGVGVGVHGCLGAGCVVSGGVLPAWLRGAVAGGGVSVGFDVGLRVFTFGGVRVCVPCAVRVFGESWCSLVLRRWARAAGVDGAKVDVLLGSAPGSGSVQSVVSGSAGSSRVSVVSSGLLSSSLSSVSAPGCASGSVVSSASACSLPAGGGRVGVGFGARVRDWGARVGVGGGVVSGGGVVACWWAGVVGRVRALVSGVGAWGLVLLGLVGVVLLVSVVVLVG